MIKANIGKIETEDKPILTGGNNHLVVSYLAKDGQEGLIPGTAVKLVDGKVEHIATDADDAIGVVYQLVEGKTKDSTVSVVVFGAIKKSAITFTAKGAACTETLVEKLRKNGIYAIN